MNPLLIRFEQSDRNHLEQAAVLPFVLSLAKIIRLGQGLLLIRFDIVPKRDPLRSHVQEINKGTIG
jgi:hypothetical protein